jgi:hypothetical protein
VVVTEVVVVLGSFCSTAVETVVVVSTSFEGIEVGMTGTSTAVASATAVVASASSAARALTVPAARARAIRVYGFEKCMMRN